MSDDRAGRPFGLRVLNGVGRAARAAGWSLVSLEPEALMARAQRGTGLEDFGSDRFRDPLARLARSFEDDAHLTLLGRLMVRTDLVRLLENRLRLVDHRKRHPDIASERIIAPIVIMGLPRTGTSILHELLAQDPSNRVPMTWEVHTPFPPPRAETFTTDPRIAATERNLSGIDRLIPDFKSKHPMGAMLPQECVAITCHEFASLVWHTSHRVTSYQQWLDRADLRPTYEGHREWLQYFQSAVPGERWVLKSPGHLWALDALLAVYPDARIVQTHRDPLKVVASLVSLVGTLRSLATDDIDPHEIGLDWTTRLADGLARTMRVRDRVQLPPEQTFDVAFPEFMRDEIAMVRQIYTHFGITLSPVAEERMRAFLATNRADKHGRHTYRLSLGGLDEATERARYAAYQTRHAIASERVE